MSGTLPANEPACIDQDSSCVELLIEARPRSIDGFAVRRLLPSVKRRLVGPFIFFDHMGPAELGPGTGFDVRPHPHIALATLTYLFDGEIVHRDSVGSHQPIRPGDVNWMVAGRGIAHSERTTAEARAARMAIHGIQSWVAFPTEDEETEPRFEHHPASTIPRVVRDGATLDVIAGTAFGARSPVGVLSPTLYVHARLQAGARVALDAEHSQRAVYVVEGECACDGRRFQEGAMIVLREGREVSFEALAPLRLMVLGGAALEGPRHMYWNFVSSSRERLDRAADDWRAGRFPKVHGDETEFIPLPEARKPT